MKDDTIDILKDRLLDLEERETEQNHAINRLILRVAELEKHPPTFVTAPAYQEYDIPLSSTELRGATSS